MNEILTVSELTLAIKKKLETQFPAVTVRGEISNFKEQSSGHLYFTLKDATSQISAVLFKGNTKGLARLPKSGDQVIAQGEINVYQPRGNYQIIIRELQYAGVGELLLKLHELKTKLEGKGWFDKSRKKPLPHLPKTIGVVTSPTGAVIQDILHVLNRRFASVHVILSPVKVQGEGAALEIAKAIEQFNQYKLADVLIVGRGGGSLEDLFAFNEECVASAIFHSQIPIISAVGHETDFSIADYVADVRAPTPSAAAEIVIAEKKHHVGYLGQIKERLAQNIFHLVQVHRHKLNGIARQPAFSSPYAMLGMVSQKIDDLSEEITTTLKQTIEAKRFQFSALCKQIQLFKPSHQVTILRDKLSRLSAHLKAIDPRTLLSQGYGILFHEKTDSVILSYQDVHVGESLRIRLHDGEIKTEVREVHTPTSSIAYKRTDSKPRD